MPLTIYLGKDIIHYFLINTHESWVLTNRLTFDKFENLRILNGGNFLQNVVCYVPKHFGIILAYIKEIHIV